MSDDLDVRNDVRDKVSFDAVGQDPVRLVDGHTDSVPLHCTLTLLQLTTSNDAIHVSKTTWRFCDMSRTTPLHFPLITSVAS